jgi:hypothetical protein
VGVSVLKNDLTPKRCCHNNRYIFNANEEKHTQKVEQEEGERNIRSAEGKVHSFVSAG